MKKYFNKSIFKDKSFIKMICFTIVLILVLILGNTFGYVSADDNISEEIEYNQGSWSGSSVLSYNGWLNSSIYDSNYWFNSELYSDTTLTDFMSAFNDFSIPTSGYSYDVVSNTGSLDFSVNSGSMNYVVHRAYIDGTSNDLDFLVFFYPDNCIYNFQNHSAYCLSDYAWVFYLRLSFNKTSKEISITNKSAYLIDTWTQLGYAEYNGIKYYYAPSQGGHEIFSNAPLYSPTDNNGSTSNSDIGEFIASNCTSSSFYNVNYMLTDGSYDDGSGSGGSGGNASNYMYADYADWYLNNYTGNITKTFKDVSVTFTSNLNDYIKDNLDVDNDVSDYAIHFDYDAYIDFYYCGVVTGGDSINVDFTKSFFGVGATLEQIDTTNYYHWYANYYFPKYNSSYNDYSSGYTMDMDNFIDNNYMWTLGLDGLFSYMEPTPSSYLVSSQGVKSNIDITLYQLMESMEMGKIVWYSNNEMNQFKLTCSAELVYLGDDDTVDFESLSYTETFNLLDGSSTVDSNGMLTNYNPYNEITDTTSNSLPSSGTSSSNSNSLSTGNVTQTVTVTNSGAEYIPSLISKLIPTSLSDTGTGLVSTFTTMAQTNGFISVMASTVPAIPSTVWTYLTNYLGISLYLLACAFVLRLILDLL